MVLGLLLAYTMPAQKTDVFYARAPYATSVPKPERILGYGPGERQTVYRDQEAVLKAIASASGDRVRLIEYGKSTQGRPLRILAISSPRNIARLDAIKKDAEALADGKASPEIEARMPAIVWINECIHGNEPASFESAMWLAYNLAASKSKEIEADLDNAVIIVNPVYNPDGHERFAVWSNSVATGSPRREAFEHREPAIVYGRLNAYRFDMNRDRVAMSQAETRQEVAEFLRWHPQVYADQHGQVSTYFFPPNPMSVNANTDRDRIAKWTDLFGRANAAAFDQRGWQYYTKNEFDLYYAGYLDSWTSLTGAIGMTYETDGGSALVEERSDGSRLTLRDGIEHHFTSALATIGAAAGHRKELVASYSAYKKKIVSGQAAGKFQRVVVEGNPQEIERFRKLLDRQGIRSSITAKELTQGDAHDYWSERTGRQTFAPGSLVVDMNQAQGAVAKAMLEPGSDFEPQFSKEQLKHREDALKEEKYPEADGTEFYDMTGWSLPYAWGLKAWWCESRPTFQANNRIPDEFFVLTDDERIGWVSAYRDADDIERIFRLMETGVRVQITAKRVISAAGATAPGSFVVLRSHNDDKVAEKLVDSGLPWKPIGNSYPEGREGFGSDAVRSIRKPEVAVVFGDMNSPTDYSSIWWLMDKEWNLPFTPITAASLGSSAIEKYSCIVVPVGYGGSLPDRLRQWVTEGGCLVSLGGDWANSSFIKLETVKEEKDHEPFSLPGSLFRAELDPRSFLSYGYSVAGEGPIPLAIPIQGGRFYKAKAEGGGVVKLSADEKAKKLLSGWEWPDTEKALVGTAWVQDQQVGRGRVVLFASDPTERAMWPGLYKLLLNAILLGPAG